MARLNKWTHLWLANGLVEVRPSDNSMYSKSLRKIGLSWNAVRNEETWTEQNRGQDCTGGPEPSDQKSGPWLWWWHWFRPQNMKFPTGVYFRIENHSKILGLPPTSHLSALLFEFFSCGCHYIDVQFLRN